MRSFRIHKRRLEFKKPAGTSRGTLRTKPAWYFELEEEGRKGIGECGLLPGLSVDDGPHFGDTLLSGLETWSNTGEFPDLEAWPSIRFGVETALASLKSPDPYIVFPSEFTSGRGSIPINGLIWMGAPSDMRRQVDEKIEMGFTCIKLKIGAIDFNSEIEILREIRKSYSREDIELRVDANGAFAPHEAMDKLETLAAFDIHSIEQPIKAGQWEEMARLCEATPLPIALDEELIGIFRPEDRERLIEAIRPQAIILKPGLLGGFNVTGHWIELARRNGAQWWITSALESNVGLNAIAQYTFGQKPDIAQGLGTGSLYVNNVDSPLYVDHGRIHYDPEGVWGNPFPDAPL